MALKLPDSAVPMGDFPVAKAVDIDFEDGENLQEKLDNGTLGGGEKIYTSTPIGTVLSFAGQTPPNGYLLCDGGSYAVADYQDLYDVIGNIYGGDSTNFNVPDYRETVLVGVGENTTDTIADHDVYGLGEFKDDQMQRITGDFEAGNRNTQPRTNGAFKAADSRLQWYALADIKTSSSKVEFDSSKVTRSSTTTHGKQKGVTYIIKAFHTNEGVDSSVELDDNVVNHINNRIENKVDEVVKKTDAKLGEKADKSYVDDNFATMDKVDEKVDELFQSVSDGKTLVANAITDKGVSTSTTATFATMATNISKINGYKEETKSYNNTSTGTTRLVFTFSADVSGVKQITPPSDASSYIVPETPTSMFTVNGTKLTLYVNGIGTWKVTAIVNNA